ncbi:MAG: hypothetical protein WBL06_15135 [Pseudolysinimonas sp.]|uniref:hypothetical protein n=1 Tax=Pseudolysinimonas sp. TaxID=2680009 RepID=UPI003C7609BB
MTTRRPKVAAVGLGALLLVGLPTVTACSMIEGIVEQQTGGDVDLGGNTVPEDFPSEVPLAEGDVVNGSQITGGGGETVWNVLMNVSDPSAPDSIAAQLEGAGFTSAGTGGVTDSGGTITYVKDDLVVNVLLGKTGSGWTANYTVARASG